jgi:hypothetical protein
MAPKGSPVRSSFKLTGNPTPPSLAPDLGETRKPAAVETPNRSCFSHPDPSHPITEPDVIIKSDDCVSTAASPGTANTGEPRITWVDTRDQNDRYFDIEAIKSCKLNSRVCSSLIALTYMLILITCLVPGDGSLTG